MCMYMYLFILNCRMDQASCLSTKSIRANCMYDLLRAREILILGASWISSFFPSPEFTFCFFMKQFNSSLNFKCLRETKNLNIPIKYSEYEISLWYVMYVLTTSCRKQIIMQRATNKFSSHKDTVSFEKKDKKLIRKRKFGSWLNICPNIPIWICKWCCLNNFVQSVKFSLTWLNNNNYYDCWCIVEYKAKSLADYMYLSAFVRCMVQKALILIAEKKDLNTSGKSNSPLKHHQLEGLDCH